jgi:RNA polymerase primary sigma factor
MPFKSQAQRRKFAKLMVEGKISPDTFEEWNRETGSAKLPERVRRKSTPKKAAKKTARKSAKKSARKATRKATKRSAARSSRKR